MTAGIGTLSVIVSASILTLILAQLIFKLFQSPVKKRKPALPGLGWKIIYTDNASAKKERKPGITYGKMLTDPSGGLHGKPDFIYSNGRRMLPVELKSGKVGGSEGPRKGDLMQLAVYFRLVEAEYNVRPRYGLLIYKDAMFTVKNTARLDKELQETLREMRDALNNPPGESEAEPSFAKCRYCACRGTVCEATP